ncbi:MAG: S-layer homology domain-containing protein [Clostridiales bacterium]|nr:S-layer homology domain-containing protein [Clostridiales bacterium]
MNKGIKCLAKVLTVVVMLSSIPVFGKAAAADSATGFADVSDTSAYYYKPVQWAVTNNITTGYKDGNFKPGNKLTRAQMVTFIWRMLGKPEPKVSDNPFSDIKKSDYWYKAALWGNENHIVEGYKDGTFGPQTVCARKHAVTFLWRLAGKPAPKTSVNRFSDVSSSDYYYKATLWASEKKILEGYKDGTFGPDKDCLRKHAVTFLYKYSNYMQSPDAHEHKWEPVYEDIEYQVAVQTYAADGTTNDYSRPIYRWVVKTDEVPVYEKHLFDINGRDATKAWENGGRDEWKDSGNWDNYISDTQNLRDWLRATIGSGSTFSQDVQVGTRLEYREECELSGYSRMPLLFQTKKEKVLTHYLCSCGARKNPPAQFYVITGVEVEVQFEVDYDNDGCTEWITEIIYIEQTDYKTPGEETCYKILEAMGYDVLGMGNRKIIHVYEKPE